MGSPFFGSIDMTSSGGSVTAVCTIFTVLPTESSGRFYYLHITDGIYMNQTFSTFSDSTLFLEWTITGLEPTLDYTFTITAAGESGSDTKVQRSPQGSGDPPYEMPPTFYPTVLHQWIIYNNTYVAQAGTCVACALLAIKEIQEYLEDGVRHKYSIGWVYGNRTTSQSQAEGMYTDQALTQLQADGTPPWDIIPENVNRQWPDNYTYNDANNLMGAKNMIANYRSALVDFARPQRIASWSKINTWTITQIKRIVYEKGYCLVGVDLYDNFYEAETNGGWIPTPHSATFRDGHNMVIIGWKYHNGMFYWICQNSWGSWDGDNGLLYLPATNNFCQGFWDITDGSYAPTKQLATPSLVTGYPTTTVDSITFKINAVTGAQGYRVQCDAPDGNYVDQTFTTTTITLTGKAANTTYTVKVKAIADVALDSDWLTFYAATTNVTVAKPRLYYTETAFTGGDRVYVSWWTVSNATTYWWYYRKVGDTEWISVSPYYGNTQTIYRLYTGLITNTAYEFGIRAVYDSTHFSDMATVTLTPTYSKPSTFAWTTAKVAEQPFNVTAAEWDRLISTVTQLYHYKGWDLTHYPMTTVAKGNTFYATYFNQVKNAIGSKLATGIADKGAGSKVYAADLNILVSTLNSLINAA